MQKSQFRKPRRPGQKTAHAYFMILPMFILAVGFVYYPFFRTIIESFSLVNFRGQITGFAGLENYRYLFSRREFATAIKNTLFLSFINVPITVFITLSLAWLCNRKGPVPAVMQTAFALPMAVSMSSIALIFKVLLNPTVGYVNYALHLNIGWLTDRHYAMPSILILTVWMGIAFNFLLFLSAFKAIPDEIVESAQLEGAGSATILFKIQLPLVSPTMLYVVCTNMIQAMMTSGPILILTQGGPARSTTTLIYFMYTSGYSSGNYSLAACVSIITFLLTLTFTLLLFKTERGRVYYQ